MDVVLDQKQAPVILDLRMNTVTVLSHVVPASGFPTMLQQQASVGEWSQDVHKQCHN